MGALKEKRQKVTVYLAKLWVLAQCLSYKSFPTFQCLYYDSFDQKYRVGRPFDQGMSAPVKPHTNVHSG